MSTKALTIGGAAVLLAAIAIFALTSGGGDDSADARETDGAFITAMTPHHEAAIEMAEIALERAEHPEIRQLAKAIVAAQEEEIEALGTIHVQMFGVPASKGDHGSLGMPAQQMGMDADMGSLERAQPFDQAFIDEMVPHHQGAIRMARVELESGEDPRLARIARGIIAGQSGEIEQMNAWRRQWYGSPSPAGGVPSDEAAMPDHSMMEH